MNFVGPNIQYSGPVIIAPDSQNLDTPLAYVRRIITDAMLANLVEQTNMYSIQNTGYWINTNAEELEKVIGMFFLMRKSEKIHTELLMPAVIGAHNSNMGEVDLLEATCSPLRM